MSCVPHEENGPTLLLLGAAWTDQGLQVGGNLVGGLETQERNVELVRQLFDLRGIGISQMQDGQYYLQM